MKIVRILSSPLLVLVAWVICLSSIMASAQSLRLQVNRDATATRLSVTNANVPNVNLQGSFDLTNWFQLQATTPVLGVASLVHTNNEPIDAWFYRAVAAPAPLVINVGPRPDTNQFVGALIFPETGGQLQITDANGVFYQLTVRSNLVTEPTAIRMTVITNFTDMPLTNRFRAAVSFAPDGFEFRGTAELKIKFPGEIPMLEMVGYGFDGTGGDFHLRPWDSATNEVTLPVSHFSGAGVAAQPFSAGGITYGEGLKFTRDAIRDADNWAGEQYRDISRNRHEGRITREEALLQQQLIKRQRNLRVYLNAIKPLLAAAATDCEVGEVVLKRLDQLEGDSGVYGEGIFYQAALKVAPSIRCICAKYYLELCERNLTASGNAATRGLDGVLDQVALMIGMTDDPNCDLGSNNEIQARMARAKCHKPWEGTVRYTRTLRSTATIGISDPEGSFTSVITEKEDFAYVGHIAELIEEDGDLSDPESTWQSWIFRLDGKLNASQDNLDTATQVSSSWTITDTDLVKGFLNKPAEGDLYLRFDNGAFTSVSASTGLGTNRHPMPLFRTTERKVECKPMRSCPPSVPSATTAYGNQNLSFAQAPGITNPNLKATWTNGSLKLIYNRTRREEFPSPNIGYTETVEVMTIQLFKGSAP